MSIHRSPHRIARVISDSLQPDVMPINEYRPQRSVWWFLLILILNCFAVPSANGQDDLLEYLVLQNSRARTSFSSVSVEYEWTCIYPSDTVLSTMREKHLSLQDVDIQEFFDQSNASVDRGEGQLVVAGKKRFEMNKVSRQAPDKHAVEDVSDGYVLNDHYVGYWSKGNIDEMWQYDYESMDQLPQRAKNVLRYWPPDLLKFGFGTGNDYLREAVEKYPDRYRWSVTKEVAADGHFVYKVTRSTAERNPFSELIIDPGTGFLVTAVKVFDTDGKVMIEREVSVQQLEDGSWFPSRVEERRLEHQLSLTVKRVQLNISPDESQFTLAALGLKEGTLVTRFKTNGESERLLFHDGELILPELTR